MSPAVDAPAHKPRNKLRKLSKFHRHSTVSPVSPRASAECGRGSGEPNGGRTPKLTEPGCLATPPDLSDPKWTEYIRKSGYLCPMDASPHLKPLRSRSPSKNPKNPNNFNNSLVPELAHLAIGVPSTSPRSSGSNEKLPPSPTTPTSTPSSIRRYAKTPVLRIGQLEGSQETRPSPDKTASSVELIAQQYRALLEARSDDEEEVDSGHEEWHDAKTRQNSLDVIRSAVARRSPRPPNLPAQVPRPEAEQAEGSPTSDSTLVGFEEDAIYFKPISFEPKPLTTILEDEDAQATTTTPLRASGLSLQICMDLLTQELTATALGRPQRGPSDVPALQILVMAEAYQKLRHQVLDMPLSLDERQALAAMLDMWLRVLYRAHDKFAEGQSSPELVGA